jgi:hypothetical protein
MAAGAAGWLGFLAFLGVVVAGACVELRSTLNHDSAWLIHGTEVFLAGGTLYRDVFELNPPLIFYETVPAVWLARLLHASSITLYIMEVFALISVSLLAGWRVLRADAALSPWIGQSVLMVAAIMLSIGTGGDFGQREHLMLVFGLPYLLLAAMRARNVPIPAIGAAAIGAFAAFGFALKPHFLVLPTMLELYVMARRRTMGRVFRPETVALAAAGLCYAVAIVVFTPQYLTTIVPFGAATYESGFQAPLIVVLWFSGTVLLPLALAIHLTTRSQQDAPELGDVLCIASVAFFGVYAFQMKAWTYQRYPLSAVLFVLLSLQFVWAAGATRARGSWAAPKVRMAYLVVPLGAVLLSMLPGLLTTRYHNEFMTEMAPIVRQQPPGSSIYVFTAKVSEGFPLVNYAGVGWSSRFDTFWLLPGLIARQTGNGGTSADGRLAEIEHFLRDSVVSDLTRHPPTLVFVDVAPSKIYFNGRSFDYITYFSADPRFAAIWTKYQVVADIGHFRVFKRRLDVAFADDR